MTRIEWNGAAAYSRRMKIISAAAIITFDLCAGRPADGCGGGCEIICA